MISIKTADGSRYDLPSGAEYKTVERYGKIWIFFCKEGKDVYINIKYVMCIEEER